jgi:hypothetical protein
VLLYAAFGSEKVVWGEVVFFDKIGASPNFIEKNNLSPFKLLCGGAANWCFQTGSNWT